MNEPPLGFLRAEWKNVYFHLMLMAETIVLYGKKVILPMAKSMKFVSDPFQICAFHSDFSVLTSFFSNNQNVFCLFVFFSRKLFCY